jgi:cell division protein FtsB
MPDDAHESSYMMAAEKAIADLQVQVADTKNSAVAARKAAISASNSARRWQVLTVVLAVVVVLVAATSAFGVVLYFQQRDATNQLRNQAINSCEIGNDRAAGTVTALDELVKLLEGPHPTSDTKAKAKAYDDFVLSHNAQRNCPQAFSK